MNNPTYNAIIISTGEEITVYQCKNGNYYDADAISSFKPPSAPVAGKKEFTPDELRIGSEV